MGKHNQMGEEIEENFPGSKNGNRNNKEITKGDNPGDRKPRKETRRRRVCHVTKPSVPLGHGSTWLANMASDLILSQRILSSHACGTYGVSVSRTLILFKTQNVCPLHEFEP